MFFLNIGNFFCIRKEQDRENNIPRERDNERTWHNKRIATCDRDAVSILAQVALAGLWQERQKSVGNRCTVAPYDGIQHQIAGKIIGPQSPCFLVYGLKL